jgi:hypothetical protein
MCVHPSDEKLYMQVLTPNSPRASARHAEAVLRAWICGDIPQLRHELESSCNLGCHGITRGGQDERLDLLSAVANSMMACEDLSESNPQIRLCVGLLAHLAAQHKCED